MDLVSVLTTVRSPSYLKETLAGLEADTARLKRMVYCDGTDKEANGYRSLKLHAGWDCISSSEEPRGNLRAFFAVCSFAYEAHADRLLYFEDDILLSPNAVPRMLQTGVPEDCAWTTFFDMKEIAPGTPPGLYRVSAAGADGKGWWGFQAAMFPKRTLIWLLSKSNEILREADAVGVSHCADYFAGHCMLRSPWPDVAVHVPSLVEHVGANTSSIWPQEGQYEVRRVAKDFLGTTKDAMALSVDTRAKGRTVPDITDTLLPGNATKTPDGVRKKISQKQHDFLKEVLPLVKANGLSFIPQVLYRDGDATVFSYVEGEPATLQGPQWSTRILREVGQMIAAFHSGVPAFCHGDLAPWNVLFRDGHPRGLIDFEKAHYGSQLEDFAYAAWTWLGLGQREKPLEALSSLRILTELTPYSVQQTALALRQVLKKYAEDPKTRSWALQTHEWCESGGFYDVQ